LASITRYVSGIREEGGVWHRRGADPPSVLRVILERRSHSKYVHSRGSKANEKKIDNVAITAIATKGFRISQKGEKLR
jgi:hypothetical protein